MSLDNMRIEINESPKHSPSIKHLQLKVFILCWAAYASAYFCRVNISVAIPSIQQSFGWSKTSLGLIGSSFFWAYGIGQLINGYLGDRIAGKIFIFIGLVVSALTNILFGFAYSILVMILLRAINGYFQSMLWGPIVKILSQWFPKEQNNRISVGISTSMVGGFLLAWGFSGQMLKYTSWHWVFIIPGIVVLFYGLIWLISMEKEAPNLNNDLGNTDLDPGLTSEVKPHNVSDSSFFDFIHEKRLWVLAIACVAQGVIKDGISLWGPAYLMETHNLDIASTASYILLIPIMNFGGIMFAGWLNKKFDYNHKLAILTLFGVSTFAAMGLFLLGQYNTTMGVLLLGLCSALMYGSNTLLLSVIPLEFAYCNRTSSVAGFLNFSSYMGSGASGILTGGISDYWGWNGILGIWICMAFIGAASVWASGVPSRHEN